MIINKTLNVYLPCTPNKIHESNILNVLPLDFISEGDLFSYIMW